MTEPRTSDTGQLDPAHYCRRCDLFRPCLCDEQRDPAADASTSNPGVIKPKEER